MPSSLIIVFSKTLDYIDSIISFIIVLNYSSTIIEKMITIILVFDINNLVAWYKY